MIRDEIILKAAIQFDPEWDYDFRKGTLGLTLYVHADCKEKAHLIRKTIPGDFEGYPVIVTYNAGNWYDNP
jgi:hypothetical protein